MENPLPKKSFPWGWVIGGCGVIAVLSAVAIVVVVFLVFKVVPISPSIRTPIIGTIPTSPVGSTPVPNLGSGSSTTVGNLPFTVSAIQDPTLLPNESLMDQMVSSLNLNNNSDFMAPKTYKGTATLDPATSFTIGNGWCAKDSTTLNQNLANMQFQISINGTSIDLSKYPTLYFTDNQGDACAVTGISITPTSTKGGSYHFVLTQKFVNSLDDGITGSPYPAGNVTFDFTIQFATLPNSGNNL